MITRLSRSPSIKQASVLALSAVFYSSIVDDDDLVLPIISEVIFEAMYRRGSNLYLYDSQYKLQLQHILSIGAMLQDVARRSWLRRRLCVKFHTKTTAAAKFVSRTRDFDAYYFMTQLGREKRTRRGGDWNEPVSQDAGWLSFWRPGSSGRLNGSTVSCDTTGSR
eukprot:scaffold4193_cov164-Skeletonema_marinoi.AAC.1